MDYYNESLQSNIATVSAEYKISISCRGGLREKNTR